ncbi:hypothetical protein, partial [Tsukamurella pseudospumae]|uniref:hypothetical protein n=1 Tax=Tsukamurella pseudospumae TaxID=239498 RepID=UPI001E284B16
GRPRLACSLRTQQCVDEIVSAKIFWHAWTIKFLVVCVVAFLVYFFARCISGIIDFCQWFRFVQDFLDYAETLCF